MAKYRSKPTEIEATQWFKHGDHPAVRRYKEAHMQDCDGLLNTGFVVTIHGQETRVVEGDWIITEPDGIHHYPCKPDIFAARYVPA